MFLFIVYCFIKTHFFFIFDDYIIDIFYNIIKLQNWTGRFCSYSPLMYTYLSYMLPFSWRNWNTNIFLSLTSVIRESLELNWFGSLGEKSEWVAAKLKCAIVSICAYLLRPDFLYCMCVWAMHISKWDGCENVRCADGNATSCDSLISLERWVDVCEYVCVSMRMCWKPTIERRAFEIACWREIW